MKKKWQLLFGIFILTLIVTAYFVPDNAKAQETASVYMVELTAYPSKTSYETGEELDLSDMILTGYYNDGSKQPLKDYQVEGYDNKRPGKQLVKIHSHGNTYYLNVTVKPAKVTNIAIEAVEGNSVTIFWTPVLGAESYYIYKLNKTLGLYVYYANTTNNRITLEATLGELQTYYVSAVSNVGGESFTGDLSEPYILTTKPGKVTGLKVATTTATSVSLEWSPLTGATGYLVYRAEGSGNYTKLGVTEDVFFTDQKLSSGTGYKYKVCAYIMDTGNVGYFSQEIITSTNPGRVTIKYKAGDKRIRLTWGKVNGADSYKIYIKEGTKRDRLLATNKGNTNTTYIAEELTTGSTYSFYIITQRVYEGKTYESTQSNTIKLVLPEFPATSTEPKYYADREAFEASSAYLSLDFFRENVDYDKSIIIPGLIQTSINGFISSKMCPQGITFAEEYLLMTAYDMGAEENSVIYVMDKVSHELLTTLVLPTKAHAGGIGYDGTYIWITVGKRVSAFSFLKLEEALKTGKPYASISFQFTCETGITASYLTYHDNKLWVGSYDELKETQMLSFAINSIGNKVTLSKVDTVAMPTRVQGLAFTDDGYLILSRSCQLYLGLRGYMRQLDIYQSSFAEAKDGIVHLGDVIKTVEMPSMNEEIAIDNGYLYVNFESAAFANASYIVDRVCAFNINSIMPIIEG